VCDADGMYGSVTTSLVARMGLLCFCGAGTCEHMLVAVAAVERRAWVVVTRDHCWLHLNISRSDHEREMQDYGRTNTSSIHAEIISSTASTSAPWPVHRRSIGGQQAVLVFQEEPSKRDTAYRRMLRQVVLPRMLRGSDVFLMRYKQFLGSLRCRQKDLSSSKHTCNFCSVCANLRYRVE
jgi:hypothetical protein